MTEEKQKQTDAFEVSSSLQLLIDKWKRENQRRQPKTVHLRQRSDFDFIKHQDALIQFAPGGDVGDSEWNLQYMHNANVMMDYKRSLQSPVCASEYYVELPADEDVAAQENHILQHELCAYYPKGEEVSACLLFDCIHSDWLKIAREVVDIHPTFPLGTDMSRILFLPNHKYILMCDWYWRWFADHNKKELRMIPAVVKRMEYS